ncbi:ABC transporter permease [Pseudonocardia sp. TRM90224]|uniref:ABC transporter permease n=1 Tax=Pseudonocardia sp. TRM90224 TaxID=2812678 RepID=UPI0027E0BA67|nr:ABC transporter permease [Pseudonocardia sp. TRM90224]
MVAYIVRRLIAAVILLLIVSAVTFAIFFVIPQIASGGSPETLAGRYVGRAATPETIKLIAERLGFYDPIYIQYLNWLKGVFVGSTIDLGTGIAQCPAPCFGYSYITNQPVWPDLLDRAPVTMSLVFGAAVIWLIFGVTTGVVSALRRGSIFDRTAMTIALGGVSLPIFFTGLVSLTFFSYFLGWTAPGGTYVDFAENPAAWAYALILPWVTLALLLSAQYARLTRAGMLETMNEDFVRTARAKGLTERDVVVKHGLRGALTPILTIFGLDVGLLLGGAVLTESTFSLNGLGKYAIDAITNQDLPKVLGVTLVAAFFIVLANLVVDLLYAVVDPRVRT